MPVRPADLPSFLAALDRDAPGIPKSQHAVDRLGYARDASAEGYVERRHGVLPTGPAVVLWPRSVVEVATVVRAAGQHGVALMPFGAGSGVVQGLWPTASTAVVDLKLLDAVHVDPAQEVVHAGAGVIGERLERALNAAGFSAGHFPSSIYCSTVGGWVAARSAGQLSSRYGKIEDMVVSLEAVDGRGHVLTAHCHDVPDLLRVLVGSEGALAIITRATLRIHRLPSHRTLLGLAAPTVEQGLDFMRRVLQAGLRPAVFRMYDPLDTVLAGGIPARSPEPEVVEGCVGRAGLEDAFMRSHASRTGAGRNNGNLVSLVRSRAAAAVRHAAWQPDNEVRLQRLVGESLFRAGWLRLPLLAVPPRCLLVLGLEGHREEVTEGLASARELGRQAGVTVLGRAPGERWLQKRYAVTWKMPPLIRAGGWADTLEVATRWSELPALYHDARAAMAAHAITLAHFSHAYPEGASIYFTVAGGGGTLEDAVAAHRATVNAGLTAFAKHGAALSHHHGVGRLKAPVLRQVQGEGAHQALLRVKAALDPHGVLNPGVLGLQGGEE